MKNSEGRIVVVDWKRSRTIRMENERANMKPPLQHISAANYWAYALQATCMYSEYGRTRAAFAQGKRAQVNLYGYILEQEYDMSVAGYYLAQVHPDGDAPRLISCPRMDAEMRAIHNFEIECGRAGPSIAGELAPFTLL